MKFFNLFRARQSQGALKGTNLRGQTEPKRRFSLIFADSRLFLENKAFGKRRFSQKTADFRRKPQKIAGTRRKPRIGVCPLRFVPFSAALQRSGEGVVRRNGCPKGCFWRSPFLCPLKVCS